MFRPEMKFEERKYARFIIASMLNFDTKLHRDDRRAAQQYIAELTENDGDPCENCDENCGEMCPHFPKSE